MRRTLLIGISIILVNLSHSQVDKYQELMSQDWANLKKYRVSNDSIHNSGVYPEVVFMGNSITEGWYNMHPEFFSANDIVGRGISGQTTPQMLVRFTQDVLDLKPKVVVILAGTNDVAGNTGFSTAKMITDNIKAMAVLADKNNIKVVLSSILPVYDYPWRPGLEPVKKITEINAWIRDYAKANGHVYLDYFPAMADEKLGMKSFYANDGVHPTNEGYTIMEPLVLEAIKGALKK